MMDPIQRAVAMPPRKIVMQRAARRKVFWDVPPLAAGAQNVHHAVHDRPNVDLRCNRRPAPSAHSLVRSKSGRDHGGCRQKPELGNARTETAGQSSPPPTSHVDAIGNDWNTAPACVVARCGARRRFETWPLRSAPCRPRQSGKFLPRAKQVAQATISARA